MKIWKLVSGILSIVFFVIVVFQSCAAGLANTLSDNGEISGSAGILVSVFLMTGGIVSIVSRNSAGKGASIALIIIFGLAALIGFSSYGSYSDLAVWSGWCLINAVVAVIALIIPKKKTAAPEE